jgi:hypothetical protein
MCRSGIAETRRVQTPSESEVAVASGTIVATGLNAEARGDLGAALGVELDEAGHQLQVAGGGLPRSLKRGPIFRAISAQDRSD